MPTAAPAPLLNVPLREFRAAGEYRRSLLYVALGGCVIAGLVSFLPQPANAPPPLERMALCAAVFIGLPAAAWIYLTTWRLRVDHVGLWRKRLGAWTCWTWEFIEKEKVFFDRRHGFLWCSARPWSDRLLGLAVLPPADAEFVLKVFLRLAGIPDDPAQASPTASAAATKLTIRTTRWTRIEIDRDGLAITDGWRTDRYPWHSVDELRLERIEQQQAVVHRFRIRLGSGSEIRGDLLFLWVDGVQDWAPHKKDSAWLPGLRGLVPKNKWRCWQTWGEPRTPAEAEFRIRYYEEQQRLARWMGRIFLPLIALPSAWIFVPRFIAAANDPFLPLGWKIVTCVCMALTMLNPPFVIWLLIRHISNAHAKKIVEIRSQVADAGW